MKVLRCAGGPRPRRHTHAARVGACAVAIAGLVGVGLAGAPPVMAATPQCGPSCVDLFSGVSANLNQPSPVLDVQGGDVGSPAVLLGASDTNPGEDFVIDAQGQVSDFYAAGLVSAAVDLHYGGGAPGFPDDQAFELEYAPNGVESGLCPGTAITAAQGTEVSLQPCGVSSKTVWIVDSSASINGSLVPLINGSDTNFSTPYVLTYPMSPSLPLETATLQNSAGQPPDNQLWSEVFGVLTPVAASTATTVASSANPSIPGQAVTYTATVSPTDEGGSVAFADGGTPINGCTGQSLNSSGEATCQVTYTSTGSHTITAAYSGDSAYVGSTSAPLTQQVVSDKADVSVSVTGPGRAADRSSFTEVLRVSNAGPAAATGVITGLVIPSGVSITSTGGGSRLGSAVYWTDPSIAAGASVTYTVALKTSATAHGTVVFAAASASTQVKDPNYANNAAVNTVALGPALARSGAVIARSAADGRLALGSRLVGRLTHHTLAHAVRRAGHGHARVDRRHRHA